MIFFDKNVSRNGILNAILYAIHFSMEYICIRNIFYNINKEQIMFLFVYILRQWFIYFLKVYSDILKVLLLQYLETNSILKLQVNFTHNCKNGK